MSEVNGEALVSILALVGLVIVIAALFSGVIERSGFPQVAVFLLLGAVLGPAGLGLITISLDTPILRIVATLSLVLVLFTDAISINVSDMRRYGVLPVLVVGPGTFLSAALVALAGWALLGLSPAASIVLGAALASTDPVLLRGLLRRDDIAVPVRQALRLEGGLNDVVLLPIVLVAMVFLENGGHQSLIEWARLALDLFLLGPAAGILVGLFGVATLDMVRRKVGIRRDYESLYSLGIAFTAYAAAEAVHGSGFLATFAAGLVISSLDVELCDCFLEYGETTSELTLLFTFVLFGSSLIWSGFTLLNGALLLFAIVALLVRPLALLPALVRVRLTMRDRLLLSWFGPRGLSSLLLILLPVFAGTPGSQTLFAICALVVVFSVIIHGASPMVLLGGKKRRSHPKVLERQGDGEAEVAAVSTSKEQPDNNEKQTVPLSSPREEVGSGNGYISEEKQDERQQGSAEQPLKSHVPLEHEISTVVQPISPLRITVDGVRKLWQEKEPVLLLDVRTERSYDASEQQAKGAIRIRPDQAVQGVKERQLSQDAWLIVYCA